MKIAVTGGRKFNDAGYVERTLSMLCSLLGGTSRVEFVHGDAPGLDTLVKHWAAVSGYPVEGVPADWATHGKGAGHLRNAQIIHYKRPDCVIAFPGNEGTANMVKVATINGKPVLDLRRQPEPLFGVIETFLSEHQFIDKLH